MKDDHQQMLLRLRMKDCGRGENGNTAGLADGNRSSADGKWLQGKVIS